MPDASEAAPVVPVVPVVELRCANIEEMRAACPTPPSSKDYVDSSASSVTSASEELSNSDGCDSANGDESKPTWTLKMPVRVWREIRLAQILEGANKCRDLGFIVYDQVQSIYRKADHVLAHVEADPSACCELRMASSGFWMCVFVLLEKYVEFGEKWMLEGVPNFSKQEELEATAKKWTLDGLRDRLIVEAGSKFKDAAKGGGQYQTEVGNNAGRKHGFARYVSNRNEDPIKKFDLRSFGPDQRRKSKMQALHLLLRYAGYDGIPPAILELQPPKIEFFKSSNSARQKALRRSWGEMDKPENKAIRERKHSKMRSIFVGARASAPAVAPLVPAVPVGPSPRCSLSIGEADRHAHVGSFNPNPDDNTSDSDVDIDDRPTGAWHTSVGKKKNSVRLEREIDAELEDGNTSYLNEHTVTAEDAESEDRETEGERKLRRLREHRLRERRGDGAPSSTAVSAAPSVAAESEQETAESGPPREALSVEAESMPEPVVESAVERVKRLQAERRAEQERADAEELAQALAAQEAAAAAAPMRDWFAPSEPIQTGDSELDDIGEIITDNDDEDEWDELSDAAAPTGADDEPDDLAAMLEDPENQMEAADSDSHIRAVERQKELLAERVEDETLSGPALKRRLRAERAVNALEKQDQGRPLTKRDQLDLDWFLERVDDDKFEETGEVVLFKKTRVLTVDQIVAKRRKEVEEGQKAERRKERMATRRRKLMADARAKRERHDARVAARMVRLDAERQHVQDVANRRVAKGFERERVRQQEADAKKAAHDERNSKLAQKRNDKAVDKLQKQLAFKSISGPRVAPVPGDPLKLAFRLPKVREAGAPSSAPPRPTRAERMEKRRAVVAPEASPVPAPTLREDQQPRIAGVGSDACVVGYALVPQHSNGTLFDLTKLSAHKRASSNEDDGASKRARS